MVGKQLKKLREERGMTIRKLAVLSGVSRSYISKIENGDIKSVGTDVAYKLALALKVNPCEFIGKSYSCIYFMLPPRWRKHSKTIEDNFLAIMRKGDLVTNEFLEKLVSLLNEFVEK